jgi:hypothetical protein
VLPGTGLLAAAGSRRYVDHDLYSKCAIFAKTSIDSDRLGSYFPLRRILGTSS